MKTGLLFLFFTSSPVGKRPETGSAEDKDSWGHLGEHLKYLTRNVTKAKFWSKHALCYSRDFSCKDCLVKQSQVACILLTRRYTHAQNTIMSIEQSKAIKKNTSKNESQSSASGNNKLLGSYTV